MSGRRAKVADTLKAWFAGRLIDLALSLAILAIALFVALCAWVWQRHTQRAVEAKAADNNIQFRGYGKRGHK